jgi:linalool dehydratase/isomerase-like protein
MTIDTTLPVHETTTTPVPALIPQRSRPDGPVTTRRLRRTLAGYLVLAAAGTIVCRAMRRRGAANLGAGMIAPGAGYLGAGKPGRFLATQFGFAGSLALWLGSGNVLAPLIVWGATAIESGRHEVRAPRANKLIPVAAGGVLAAALAARKRAYRRDVHVRDRRNAYLRELGASEATTTAAANTIHVVRDRSAVTAPLVLELTEDQLAQTRFALDRALQPVDQFEGYDRIEQFQTSSIRYQVAVNGYALTSVQYAHTPAFHGYLSEAQRNTIDKWQERVCWGFWSKESLWGHLRYNPNPIPRDDIMVSGWLGYQIAGYTATTGDDHYTRPGSISFRHPRGMRYDYDLHSLTEVLVDNFAASEFGLFPCEPNWIYALCNGFGILPLPIHDQLYGTDYAQRILPGFRRGFESEFLSTEGRTVGLRSKWTGLTVPAMTSILSDASVIWQIHPVFPDLARRQWEILRREMLTVRSDGSLDLKFRGWDGIDTGNYKRSNVGALLWLRAAAVELGDLEIADAITPIMDAQGEPVIERGVRRYAAASAQANLGLLLASTGRPHAHYDRINRGIPTSWATGPILSDAAYPDVLVARAVTDGTALDLVLRPGTTKARQRLQITRLRPNATYTVSGAVDRTLTADPAGSAFIDVDLTGRVEIAVTPTA